METTPGDLPPPRGEVRSASLWPAADPDRLMEFEDRGDTHRIEGGHFDSVADPTRRSILEALRRQRPLSVTALSAPLPISRHAVTKHLDVLEEAGLIEKTQRG